MENNKYLDKVVGSLVRGTKMDYDKGRVRLSFFPYPFFPHHFTPVFGSFSRYCKNVYGLTEDEIKYVWKEFLTIINEKVEN